MYYNQTDGVSQHRSDPVQGILRLVRNPKQRKKDHWRAHCPAHPDHKPSLDICYGRDGRALLHCHAGCRVEDILKALNLKRSDLFDFKGVNAVKTPETGRYSHKRTPAKTIATYDYVDENGELLYQVRRLEDKSFPSYRPDGKGGWIKNMHGVRRVLYRLPKVLKARNKAIDSLRAVVDSGADIETFLPGPEGLVFIVEGEKDVHSLEDLGLVATTNPSGATAWQDYYVDSLLSAFVVIIPDNDDAGRKRSQVVADSLCGNAMSVRIVELPGLEEKEDVSDWIARGGSLQQILDIVYSTLDYEPAGQTGEMYQVKKDDVTSYAESSLGTQIAGFENRDQLRNWYRHPEHIEKMLPILGIPEHAVLEIGSEFPCVLPDRQAKERTARLFRSDDGYIGYETVLHGKSAGMSLVHVFMARAYGTLKKVVDVPEDSFEAGSDDKLTLCKQVNKPEYVLWSIRLVADAGLAEVEDIAAPQLPDGLSKKTPDVWKGFLRLEQCRRLYSYWEETPFSQRFAAAWCCVHRNTAEKAINELMARRLLDKTGVFTGIGGKKVGIFKIGDGVPVREHLHKRPEFEMTDGDVPEERAKEAMPEDLDFFGGKVPFGLDEWLPELEDSEAAAEDPLLVADTDKVDVEDEAFLAALFGS